MFDPPVENADIDTMVSSLVSSRRDVLLAEAGKRRKEGQSDQFRVTISLVDVNLSQIRKDTDEMYSLTVESNVANIKAATVFGALHAIETLFQVRLLSCYHPLVLILSIGE